VVRAPTIHESSSGSSEIEGKVARVAASESGPSEFQIRVIRGLLITVKHWCAFVSIRGFSNPNSCRMIGNSLKARQTPQLLGTSLTPGYEGQIRELWGKTLILKKEQAIAR
jgi:hypothetical protein